MLRPILLLSLLCSLSPLLRASLPPTKEHDEDLRTPLMMMRSDSTRSHDKTSDELDSGRESHAGGENLHRHSQRNSSISSTEVRENFPNQGIRENITTTFSKVNSRASQQDEPIERDPQELIRYNEICSQIKGKIAALQHPPQNTFVGLSEGQNTIESPAVQNTLTVLYKAEETIENSIAHYKQLIRLREDAASATRLGNIGQETQEIAEAREIAIIKTAALARYNYFLTLVTLSKKDLLTVSLKDLRMARMKDTYLNEAAMSLYFASREFQSVQLQEEVFDYLFRSAELFCEAADIVSVDQDSHCRASYINQEALSLRRAAVMGSIIGSKIESPEGKKHSLEAAALYRKALLTLNNSDDLRKADRAFCLSQAASFLDNAAEEAAKQSPNQRFIEVYLKNAKELEDTAEDPDLGECCRSLPSCTIN